MKKVSPYQLIGWYRPPSLSRAGTHVVIEKWSLELLVSPRGRPLLEKKNDEALFQGQAGKVFWGIGYNPQIFGMNLVIFSKPSNQLFVVLYKLNVPFPPCFERTPPSLFLDGRL